MVNADKQNNSPNNMAAIFAYYRVEMLALKFDTYMKDQDLKECPPTSDGGHLGVKLKVILGFCPIFSGAI